MDDHSRQILYLLRHAKAAPWAPGVNDFDRVLNDRGHRHMRELADWIGETLSPPELILCSPSARTRETLVPIAAAWPGSGDSTRFLPEIYEATTGTLHALAGESFKTVRSIMMVGHNPGLEYLAVAVLSHTDAAAVTKMAPGTLAVIEFETGWENDSGRGSLRHWIRRRDLGHRSGIAAGEEI